MMVTPKVPFQNRYPYSAKIYCKEHGTTFHRQVLESKKGRQEVWRCKVYRTHGRAACSAPPIRSCDLDAILSEIFNRIVRDKQAIMDSLVTVISNVPKEVDYNRLSNQVQAEMAEIGKKKDRLLELSIAGAMTVEEFKQRNDAFNARLSQCESQLRAIEQEAEQASKGALDLAEIHRCLKQELSFDGEPNEALLTTILEKIVVKKGSTREEIHLDIFLKLGERFETVYTPRVDSASIRSLKTDNAREDFLQWTEGTILFACCGQREYIEMRCLQPGKVLVTAGLCSV